MPSLDVRVSAANTLLAPFAVPHQGTLGRPATEPLDLHRSPFQRDRGRIVHSLAFRRLQGKTQVFMTGESDHVRTRLTHTMEVALIARDMARSLSLQEDLAECIALAHDLGHPPFGHMGEDALDRWMRTHGLSFEHNAQSLRIVTVLEQHSPHAPGLNLNREVLEGLRKHGTREERGGRGLSLEAQTVNVADEIAYLAHDSEDGIRAALFTLPALAAIPLIRQALEDASGRNTPLRGALIRLLAEDAYATAQQELVTRQIRSLEDVYRCDAIIVKFSPRMQPDVLALRLFLAERMYGHPRVRDAHREGQHILTRLCEGYLAMPTDKILELQRRTGGSLPEAVKDYVAGMTDAFARTQVASLPQDGR